MNKKIYKLGLLAIALFTLTSATPLDENTLEEPTKVSPKTETIKLAGKNLKRIFPGNSLTIIRIPNSINK
jgi:hypothetical protein